MQSPGSPVLKAPPFLQPSQLPPGFQASGGGEGWEQTERDPQAAATRAWGREGTALLQSWEQEDFACVGRDGHTGVLAGVLLWWLLYRQEPSPGVRAQPRGTSPGVRVCGQWSTGLTWILIKEEPPATTPRPGPPATRFSGVLPIGVARARGCRLLRWRGAGGMAS